MDGGTTHKSMVSSSKKAFRDTGIEVSLQVRIRRGNWSGYIDLLAHTSPKPLVVEVEMSPRRVANDLLKAKALGAHLWIVVPNQRVATGVRRQLRRLRVREETGICVLSLGQALQRIRNCFSLFSMPLSGQNTKGNPAQERHSFGPT